MFRIVPTTLTSDVLCTQSCETWTTVIVRRPALPALTVLNARLVTVNYEILR